jgi:hypothetical protein
MREGGAERLVEKEKRIGGDEMKIMSQEKDSQRGQTSGKQQSAIHPWSCTQTKFVLCAHFSLFFAAI